MGYGGGAILVKQGRFQVEFRQVTGPGPRSFQKSRNLAPGPGFPVEAPEVSGVRRGGPKRLLGPLQTPIDRRPRSVAESLRLDDEPKFGERLVVGVARENRTIELERHDHRLVETSRPT